MSREQDAKLIALVIPRWWMWLPRPLRKLLAMRRIRRCYAGGHEPFHMRDDGSWYCECCLHCGTWGTITPAPSAASAGEKGER